MVVTKWEELVKEAERRLSEKEARERRLLYRYVATLKKLITVELLIGIIAAFSMYMQYGWKELERTLLSWIIGITLAATIVTFMIERYKRITHIK